MNSDIANAVESCQQCQEILPSQVKEPIKADPLPTKAFESVSVDFFSFGGNTYLAYSDRYSGFPLITAWMKDPNAAETIHPVRQHFCLMDTPILIRTDGGPQFASREFQEFLKQ
jgi:hypothetical protein